MKVSCDIAIVASIFLFWLSSTTPCFSETLDNGTVPKVLLEPPIDKELLSPASTCHDLHAPASPMSADNSKTLTKANDSLTRPDSYASILMDPKRGSELTKQLGEKCASFLKDIYRTGNTLYSDVLRRAATSVSSWPMESGDQDATFFHYTDSHEMIALFYPNEEDRGKAHQLSLKNKKYDEIFTYLRTTKSFWKSSLHVAEDPYTSQAWGKFRIVLNFNPDSKVIDLISPVWLKVQKELSERYPGLDKACIPIFMPNPGEPVGGLTVVQRDIPLIYISADDSNIDFINYQMDFPAVGKSWFLAISLKSLKDTRVEDKTKPKPGTKKKWWKVW